MPAPATLDGLRALAEHGPDELDDAAAFVARDLAVHLAIAAAAVRAHLQGAREILAGAFIPVAHGDGR